MRYRSLGHCPLSRLRLGSSSSSPWLRPSVLRCGPQRPRWFSWSCLWAQLPKCIPLGFSPMGLGLRGRPNGASVGVPSGLRARTGYDTPQRGGGGPAERRSIGLGLSRSGRGFGKDEGGTSPRPRGVFRELPGPDGRTPTAGKSAVFQGDDHRGSLPHYEAEAIRECRPSLRGALPTREQRSVQTQMRIPALWLCRVSGNRASGIFPIAVPTIGVRSPVRHDSFRG